MSINLFLMNFIFRSWVLCGHGVLLGPNDRGLSFKSSEPLYMYLPVLGFEPMCTNIHEYLLHWSDSGELLW